MRGPRITMGDNWPAVNGHYHINPEVEADKIRQRDQEIIYKAAINYVRLMTTETRERVANYITGMGAFDK